MLFVLNFYSQAISLTDAGAYSVYLFRSKFCHFVVDVSNFGTVIQKWKKWGFNGSRMNYVCFIYGLCMDEAGSCQGLYAWGADLRLKKSQVYQISRWRRYVLRKVQKGSFGCKRG